MYVRIVTLLLMVAFVGGCMVGARPDRYTVKVRNDSAQFLREVGVEYDGPPNERGALPFIGFGRLIPGGDAAELGVPLPIPEHVRVRWQTPDSRSHVIELE